MQDPRSWFGQNFGPIKARRTVQAVHDNRTLGQVLAIECDDRSTTITEPVVSPHGGHRPVYKPGPATQQPSIRPGVVSPPRSPSLSLSPRVDLCTSFVLLTRILFVTFTINTLPIMFPRMLLLVLAAAAITSIEAGTSPPHVLSCEAPSHPA